MLVLFQKMENNMKSNNQVNSILVQEKIQSLGIDLSVAASLVKLLDISISSKMDVKMSDIENLISIINTSMQKIVEKHDHIENVLKL